MSTARRVIHCSEELKSAGSCGLPSKPEDRLRVATGKKMIASCVVLTVIGSFSPIRVSKATAWAACGTNELQRGSEDGKVIIGPAAANLARGLMGDRRLQRGRRFFISRGFALDLDDAVVIVGNKGERAVFIPFTDGLGAREAYLFHTSKGNKEKVTAFVLYFGQGQAYTRADHAAIVKAGYSAPQDELMMPEVEVAYTIYDYDTIGYDDIGGEVVFSDGYGEIAVSSGAASGVKRILKCSLAACASGALGCALALKGFLVCFAVTCVAGTAGCTLREFGLF